MREEVSSTRPDPRVGSPAFVTTQWSLVLTAAEGDASSAAFDALSSLCQTYWFPLYAYVRRRGFDAASAADSTQAFFAELLAKNYVGQADPTRGRFRSFLLKALEHFLAKEWQKGCRLKRGGGVPLVSFDACDADARWQLEPVEELTADRVFDRRWALTVLEQGIQRLRAQYIEAGRSALFEACQGFLSGDAAGVSLAQVSERLGMTEGAVKVAVHRLRQRYGRVLRQIIAETVARPEDVEQELRHLMLAVSR